MIVLRVVWDLDFSPGQEVDAASNVVGVRALSTPAYAVPGS